MKTPPNQTASESAPEKANSTPLTFDSQHPRVPTTVDKESLYIIGDVAGGRIAAYLQEQRSASFANIHQGAI